MSISVLELARDLKQGIVAVRNGVAVYSEDKKLNEYFSCTLNQYILGYVNCEKIKVQTYILREKHDAVIIIGNLEHTEAECDILLDMFDRVGIKTNRETIFSIVGISYDDEQPENSFANNVFSHFSQPITNHCTYRTHSKNLVLLEQNNPSSWNMQLDWSAFAIFSVCVVAISIFYIIAPFKNPAVVLTAVVFMMLISFLIAKFMVSIGNFSAIHMYRFTSNQTVRIVMLTVGVLTILEFAKPVILQVTHFMVNW